MANSSFTADSLDDAAAAWLLAHDRGLTSGESTAFANWVARSPAHLEAWAHACAVWDEVEPDCDPLLASMHQDALAFRPARLRFLRIGSAVAASALLALGVAGWQFSDQLWPTVPSPGVADQVASSVFSTTSVRRAFTLADGSRVLLDAATTLSVRQTSRQRDVDLRSGRAFFEVTHDPSRSFVVTAGSHSVTATGTAFGVAIEPRGLSVVLEQGQVTVAMRDESRPVVKMVAGQMYQATVGAPDHLAAADTAAVLAWREGYLVLKNTPVHTAIDEMNRYASIKLSIGDQAAGSLRISGRFRTDDPVRFATTLADVYPVEVRKRADGGVELVSRSR